MVTKQTKGICACQELADGQDSDEGVAKILTGANCRIYHEDM